MSIMSTQNTCCFYLKSIQNLVVSTQNMDFEQMKQR